jgi:hypothetical protein
MTDAPMGSESVPICIPRLGQELMARRWNAPPFSPRSKLGRALHGAEESV